MSGVEQAAAVLAEHSIVRVGGGTASVSFWECLCGDRGEIRGGLREWASASGRRHIAEALATAGLLADT